MRSSEAFSRPRRPPWTAASQGPPSPTDPGGGIEIDSRPEQGTTVRVLLPVVEVLNTAPRRRTILAIEDDPSVRLRRQAGGDPSRRKRLVHDGAPGGHHDGRQADGLG